MKSKIDKDQKGFTIIEVVLVLAIAGLIFLIVFLALPQLQRSRRDTQRKNDVGRILAELENYASNNNGDYPANQAESNDFKTRYMGGVTFNDPSSGAVYDLLYQSTLPSDGDISLQRERVCDNEDFSPDTNNLRDIAVIVKLESGNVYYCADNR
jgi:prepilin-type N-terminal cleavage/methylation domain-containing protein